MGKASFLLVFGLLALARGDVGQSGSSSEDEERIVQKDDGSFSGYLTDILCWDRRTAIDGADMLLSPQDHTVHCMRDLQECIDTGFGVLEKPDGAAEFRLKYTFDSAGNDMTLALLKASRKRNNYVVSVKGDFSGGGVKVSEIVEYTSGPNVGGGGGIATMGDLGSSAPGVLIAHFVLMLIAYALLFPLGVAVAATGRRTPEAATGAWLTAHRRVQSAGLLAMLGGLACAIAFADSRGAHFKTSHTFVGIAVVALTAVQPLMAAARPHPPQEGEAKSDARRNWELAHKLIGTLTLAGGLVAIGIGINLLFALGFDAASYGTAIALAALFLLPVLAYTLAAKNGMASGATRWLVVTLGGAAQAVSPAAKAHDADFNS
jgi:uncharacterized membrane protein